MCVHLKEWWKNWTEFKNSLIQFLTLRKLCSFVRSKSNTKPMASLKNAVVKLRNLREHLEKRTRIIPLKNKTTVRTQTLTWSPLLTGRVPQLDVNSLTSPGRAIRTVRFIHLKRDERRSSRLSHHNWTVTSDKGTRILNFCSHHTWRKP